VHEIKLDGFRMMVRRDAAVVRLLTRNGIDWTPGIR
jgi:ATP-dependent DNA ligase